MVDECLICGVYCLPIYLADMVDHKGCLGTHHTGCDSTITGRHTIGCYGFSLDG